MRTELDFRAITTEQRQQFPGALLLALASTCACNPSPEADAGVPLDDGWQDEGTAGCLPPICVADPCRDHAYCVDSTQLVVCARVDCSDPRICGTPCCEGGGCVANPPSPCPTRTVCYEGSRDAGRVASCLPPLEPDAGADAVPDVDYDGWSRPEMYVPWCR